jgi:hypothetical protein
MDIVKFEHVGSKILDIRGRKVILDSDLAELYGVETKRINEAVKNNPDRFLDDYITELTLDEKKQLVENFDRFNRLKHSSVLPKAFTEKGLYMMATILKSPQAVQTTVAIIEAFARLRELSRNIQTLSTVKDEQEQQSLMQKSGEIISEIFDNDLQTSDTETSFEINFAVLKFKHLIKKKVK